MKETNINNKRIAKNTLLLYIRMLITMLVSLYTSRVILATLGVEDYGIYGVVGGIVTMFAFLNNAMASGTQRYLTYELGRGKASQLKKVFNMSIRIHFLIALIILILGETVGLWFFYTKLVIPSERLFAAFWVYQLSIMATMIMIISVPYNALIIAHEKMSTFAYVSIYETFAKLGIVYLLLLTTSDKLIIYAILILSVQISVRIIYGIYCKKHFPESKFYKINDKKLFHEMLSFAGWNFWGNFAAMAFSQGINILLNMFFGPIVNAARSIAVQVQTVVTTFSSNFQMALNPQITKSYAADNIQHMHSLIFRSSKFTYFLLFIISVPIFIKIDYILSLWLEEVPQYTSIFLRFMLCISIVDAVANPIMVAASATGKIKKYQTCVGLVLLSIAPISYVVLKLGGHPASVFIVHLIVGLIAFVVRIYIVQPLIKLSIRMYIQQVVIPIFLFTIVGLVIPFGYNFYYHENNLLSLILQFGISSLSSLTIGYLFLFTKSEREFFIAFLQKFFSSARASSKNS